MSFFEGEEKLRKRLERLTNEKQTREQILMNLVNSIHDDDLKALARIIVEVWKYEN